ncbi:MAG TPA: Nramp family divalent metal transporter [Cyclobacteriaceae bacterium]|nr:Nramp family divalent metal transporter [Cyclobacteriaceae bacterium]
MDHYSISAATIREPPTTAAQRVRFLGPGFILSASIVGSGELIATTTLGAQAGFVAFWVIIVSCLVKVAVQLEFGRHTILSGATAMQIFNGLPGPRFGKGRWSVWIVLLMMLLKVVQLGGMLGSAAIVLHMLFGAVPVWVWITASALTISLLIYRGYYRVVEKTSLWMIGMFTAMTLISVIALTFTPYGYTFSEIASGLTFHLPPEVVAVAIGAFGITGVGSDEILAYNYWCIEKGYAAYAGPRDDSEAWRTRAAGWVRVMHLDAFLAMVIYTAVTAAFYLLGAAVLHDQGAIPSGNQLIATVSLIYTETLGSGVRNAYLIGAFFVLFSSVFASLAAWTRLYGDIFGQLGWIDFRNQQQRKKVVGVLAWALPVVWASVYLFMEVPVFMILFGGAVGSLLLLLLLFAVIYTRYYTLQAIKTGTLDNITFWISAAAILGVAVYGISAL